MSGFGGRIAAAIARLGIGPVVPLARRALAPGVSSRADVHRLMGVPAAVHAGPAGNERLEYRSGPAGTETWMVDVSADGRYLGMRNVLVDEVFDRLADGATIDETIRLLGRPTASDDFPRLGERVLGWKYREAGGRIAYFNAHFDTGGRLVRRSRTPDPESINAQ